MSEPRTTSSFRKEKVEEFLRSLLADLLSQCTEEEREGYQRFWPKGVPSKELEGAVDLCARTVEAHEKPKPKGIVLPESEAFRLAAIRIAAGLPLDDLEPVLRKQLGFPPKQPQACLGICSECEGGSHYRCSNKKTCCCAVQSLPVGACGCGSTKYPPGHLPQDHAGWSPD